MSAKPADTEPGAHDGEREGMTDTRIDWQFTAQARLEVIEEQKVRIASLERVLRVAKKHLDTDCVARNRAGAGCRRCNQIVKASNVDTARAAPRKDRPINERK